jgi:hypothetical protein
MWSHGYRKTHARPETRYSRRKSDAASAAISRTRIFFIAALSDRFDSGREWNRVAGMNIAFIGTESRTEGRRMTASQPFPPNPDRDTDKTQDDPTTPNRRISENPSVEDPRAPQAPVRDPAPSTRN